MTIITTGFNFLKNNWYQILKFLIVGISTAFIDLISLIILKEKFSFSPVWAVVLNQILVVAYNFSLNKHWSFNNRSKSWPQIIKYGSLLLVNYLISITLMAIFTKVFAIDYRLVRLGSIGLMFVINFIAYKYWVYKEK